MMKNIYIVLIALLVSAAGFAQKTITGVVTDETNIPLPGASIIVKNTTRGAITDFDGVYTIEANEGDVLTFSMIGMVTQNIKVGSQTTINVVLKTDVAQLDEVVVVGYGSVAKKDLTGSVGTVKVAELESAVVANFDEALTGRIAGVNVSASEGTPGEALKIVVRGGNSITNSNDPLYVVNGLPLEDFDPATISTSDIESFQVLKDASATAIYGSRGANGVVVITTKSGRGNTKTTVSLDLSTSLQEITKTLDVLSPYQYVKHLQTQAIARDGFQILPEESDDSYLSAFINKWVDPELYRDVEGTDWQNEAFQVAPMTQGNLSIRGGSPKTNIAFTAGFVDQEGVLITTGFKRWNNNFTIRHELNDKVSLWGAMNYTKSNRIGPRMRNGRGNQQLRNIILYRPVNPLNPQEGENEDGLIPGVNDQEYANLFNPIKDMENTTRNDIAHNIRVNTTLTWKITDFLTFKTTNGFNTRKGEEGVFYGAETQQGARSENGINGQINGYEYSTFSTSNTLGWNKKVKKNRYNMLVGAEFVENTAFTSRLWNKNLPTDEFGLDNLDIATRPTIAMTDASKNRLMSFFARANVNFDQKYLLTATFRADGSSKFQGDNRWGYFPSFSGAWQIGNEDFMDEVEWVNSLKLRAGWGLTGNNRIGNYAAINQFGIGIWNGYVFGNSESYQPGGVQSNFAVPDLRWETTGQTNIGLDFSMFGSRFSGTLDYYYKKTEDLLLAADMSLSTGFPRAIQNVGSVSNKGFELTLSGYIVDNKNFTWQSSFNISTNENEILGLNQGQEFIKSDPQIDWGNEFYYISEVGQPVGMMYGLVFDGLYQAEDFIYDPSVNPNSPYILREGIPSYPPNVGPGHAKYVDQNGDGVIDQDDRVVIGDPYPKHFGGFNNNFKYKNFDLGVLLQWSYDFDVFNANKALWSYPTHNSSFSRLATVADAWTPWNTDTDVVAHYSNGYAPWPRSGFKGDTRYIEDGSYLRLKTVTFGYNVPMKASSGFTSLRFAVSGQNLYTWTDYSGFDPEVAVGGNPLMQNLDFSAYPKSRTYSLSVSAKF